MTWGQAGVWGAGVAQNDRVVSNISFADVSASNGDPFTSDTQSVRARWPGAALTVVWQSSKLVVGSVVHVTALTGARVRADHLEVTVAGSVTISRSSGGVLDEKFEATIGPAT